VDLDAGFCLRVNDVTSVKNYLQIISHAHLLSHQRYLPQVFTTLPRWEEDPAWPGRSGWFLLCGCLQLSVRSLTCQGSWASPGVCLY